MTAIAAPRPTASADGLRVPLLLAGVLHAGLFAVAIYGNYFHGHEDSWGGPGGSVTVGVVGNVPAIPLPEPDVQTPNRVVDESKGLYQSPPKALPKPEPDATPIPKFEKNKVPKYKEPPKPPPQTLTQPPPKYQSPPSRTLENPTEPPPNAVPYGGGGAPAIPRSSPSFAMGNGATQGGLAFNGGANGGDFGSRFGYYVEAVQRRVSSNWLQSTIDPSLGWAPRVLITFDILRDGTVTNIQILQSSNNYSVDTSAVRAVQQSSPLQPLPGGYAGSRVGVQFYFDYRRQ